MLVFVFGPGFVIFVVTVSVLGLTLTYLLCKRLAEEESLLFYLNSVLTYIK